MKRKRGGERERVIKNSMIARMEAVNERFIERPGRYLEGRRREGR